MRTDLRALRLAIVDADRDLRNAKDDYEKVSARRTLAAAPTGKNKEERETQIAVFLADDGEYQAALAIYRDAEWRRDRALALLEAAKDERRAAEWQIRCKLADALFARGVPSDASDPISDVAYEDSAQYELDDARIYAAQNGVDWDF